MAMKSTVSEKHTSNERKNVVYGTNTKDYALIRRIPFGTSGFVTGTVNPKSSFVFSNTKENRNYKPLESRPTIDNPENIESVNSTENEGSKGDIHRKISKDELSRNLGCDGDVAKHKIPTKYYLCSSGANGDILKPLDDNFIKSLENNSCLHNKSENTDAAGPIIFCKSPSSKPEKLKKETSSCQVSEGCNRTSEKKTDFLSFLASLVINWKGNAKSTDKKDKTIISENKTTETSVITKQQEKSEKTTSVIQDSVSDFTNYDLPSLYEQNTIQEQSEDICNSTMISDEKGETCISETSGNLYSDSFTSNDLLVYETDSVGEESTINKNDVESNLKETDREITNNSDCKCDKVIETVESEVILVKIDKNLSRNISTDIDLSRGENKPGILETEECKKLVQITENNVQNKEVSEEKDEKDDVVEYLIEIKKKLEWKRNTSVANRNINICRTGDSFFAKLDSSVKKNTSFVKKLKNFTSNQVESLLKDVHNINLSKYLSEAASAIVNAKLKILDILPAVELCNELHQIYSDLSSLLLMNFHRCLLTRDEEEMTNCKKLNVDLKFYVELMNIGILDRENAFPLVITVLTRAIIRDKSEYTNVSALTNFYKYCKEGYAIPRKMRNLAEKHKIKLPSCCLLLPEEEQKVKTLLNDYYSALVEQVIKIYYEVQTYQKQNRRILQLKGELTRERKDKFEALKLFKERLWFGVKDLAEVMDEVLPDLIDANADNSEMTEYGNAEDEHGDNLVWADKEEQQFYENLTDLKFFLPSVSIKASPHNAVSHEEPDLETVESEEDSIDENIKKLIGVEEVIFKSCTKTKTLMETFLSLLPSSMNCEMIDQLAVEFITTLNNKGNRKKLVMSLFKVPRTRSDLLPFYARLVATLHPFISEISVDLCQLLKYEFKYHIHKKDQINIESKLKVVRYIGELVKFKLYSKIEGLYCLKLLLRDFSHHHIEMFCTLLETCGRYLYRHISSHHQIKVYLEQMMRKKYVTVLDSRYITMIDNAFYYVDPPSQITTKKKEQLPPMQEFIQKILYQDLSKFNIEDILQLMCKVDWENNEVTEFAINCLIMAYNVKYNSIAYLASVVSGLTCEIERIGVLVVDGVMEDIRLGMEINMRKYNQRRLAMVKYIGELYKYRVAESNEVFQVLYSLISFGVTLSYSSPSYLDPPNHLFRIRLCCTLLETCGKYFSTGSSSKKLSCFLIYFQRYFWFKYEDKFWNINSNHFPVGIEYLFKDTLLNLNSQIQLFSSFQEANQAVNELQTKLASKLSSPHVLDNILPLDLLSTVEEESDSITEESSNDSENQNLSEISGLAEKQNFDNDFIFAFNQMVSENIQNRTTEMIKPQYTDIPIPMNIRNSFKRNNEKLLQAKFQEMSMINFVLLMKKGHKQLYKSLDVPVDSELAINLKTTKEADRAEKEHVKKLTLGMNKRLEEESYEEMFVQAQRTNTTSHHNEKRNTCVGFILSSRKVR